MKPSCGRRLVVPGYGQNARLTHRQASSCHECGCVQELAMRPTRLIFIEGLPGSGKSTTARNLTAWLVRAGVAAHCCLEVEPDHPLNVGGDLHPAGMTLGTELFGRYTVEAYVAESLQRWQRFVALAQKEQATSVVESYPYQNAVRVLLQMDTSPDRIKQYVAEVEEIVEPLAPVLIYLERTDSLEAIQATSRQRGEAWTSYAIELITGCPYARRRGLVGESGVMALVRAYEMLVRDLLMRSRLPRLTLTDCMGRWPECYQQIGDFLRLGLGLEPQQEE
jgi:thymidylate kinase